MVGFILIMTESVTYLYDIVLFLLHAYYIVFLLIYIVYKPCIPFVATDSKTDASAGKESKHQPKLLCDEMEKSVQIICDDVLRHQENMKSWTERYRSLELEMIEDSHTINQLKEELAQMTKSKDAIISQYSENL